jgi:hypothetical protein
MSTVEREEECRETASALAAALTLEVGEGRDRSQEPRGERQHGRVGVAGGMPSTLAPPPARRVWDRDRCARHHLSGRLLEQLQLRELRLSHGGRTGCCLVWLHAHPESREKERDCVRV